MSEPSTGPGRHEARERAIALLYEARFRAMTGRELIAVLPVEPDPYAIAVVEGVDDHVARIDKLIDDHAKGWTVTRMAPVDSAILRLATWELLERPDVPGPVAIDEAVELAKDYGAEPSPAFINGILDAIAARVRGAEIGDGAGLA